MSRTRKDYKKNKLWDNRVTEHKSGVKKEWKRRSSKKIRRTPLTSTVLDMVEIPIELKIIASTGNETLSENTMEIVLKIPTYVEVENHPHGSDPWELD